MKALCYASNLFSNLKPDCLIKVTDQSTASKTTLTFLIENHQSKEHTHYRVECSVSCSDVHYAYNSEGHVWMSLQSVF